jgi:PEP-CTERM motif
MSCSLSVFAGGTQVAPVPEPATILLVAGAGGALFVIRKLRNKK